MLKGKTEAMQAVRLQFITHYTERYDYAASAQLALEGGCHWIQLRAKDLSVDELEPLACQVRRMCEAYGATFLIDDHVELALRTGAHGVHLGRNDMPVDEARRLMGPDRIIGGTANTLDDIRRLWAAGADYVGCGPFRFTTTKKNLSTILGLEGYARLMQEARNEGIVLPVVAIGGITTEDIPALMQTGVDGIALSGSVLRAQDPVAAMRRIVSGIKAQ